MSITSKTRRDLKKKKAKANRKKVRQRKIESKARKRDQSEVVTWKLPRLEISDEERRAFADRIGNEQKERIPELLDWIKQEFRTYDPVMLIATLACYGLTTFANHDGVDSSESRLMRLNQSHVEILHAILLQIPENEYGVIPVNPEAVGQLAENIVKLGAAKMVSGFSSDRLDMAPDESSVVQLQEMTRIYTQNVRNWGYHNQMISRASQMYGEFDEVIRGQHGFSGNQAISIFKSILNLFESRVTKHAQEFSRVASKKNKNKMVSEYHSLIGLSEGDSDIFRQNINKISREKLLIGLLYHYDFINLKSLFCFDSEQISEHSGLDETVVRKVLHHCAMKSGELASEETDRFFLDNPIWIKPIIALDDEYLCFIPPLFFSFIDENFEAMLNLESRKSVHAVRAKYLEDRIESVIKQKFPLSSIFRNCKWTMDGALYETDIIVSIDSYLIIIEAKSHKISKSALRGSDLRMKRYFKEAIIEPSVQSLRLVKKLGAISNDDGNSTTPNDFPFEVSKVSKILRVSVTLDDFAMLQTNLHQFNPTGWIPDEYTPCLTISLGDFETLFDLLESPDYIIHYLQRRNEMQHDDDFVMHGDEIDFMGMYLSDLLSVDKANYGESAMLVIHGMSKHIDKYYASKDEGIDIEKPKPKTVKLFRDIVHKLKDRCPYRWLEMACISNSFHPDTQIEVVRDLQRLSRVVNRRWKEPKHVNSLRLHSNCCKKYSLVLFLFKEANADLRKDFVNQAASYGLDIEGVEQCLVIGINIDRKDSPYHIIGLAEPRKETGSDQSFQYL